MSKLRAAPCAAHCTAQTLIPSLGVNIATDWSTWRVTPVTVAGATPCRSPRACSAPPEVESDAQVAAWLGWLRRFHLLRWWR